MIVCSRAVGESARRRLHIPQERITVIPLAVGEDFAAAARDSDRLAQDRARLALPPRYLAFAGRYDARKDLRTVFSAMARLRERGGGRTRLVVALDLAFPDDHGRIARAVEATGVGDLVTIAATTGARQRAALIAGAQAFVYPALTEATALPVLEALTVGVPVISSRTGALPETVGSAGIVVEPRDPARMASALEAIWAAGPLAQQLREHAERRAGTPQRTWHDVASDTRVAYAQAGQLAPRASGEDDHVRSGLRRFAVR